MKEKLKKQFFLYNMLVVLLVVLIILFFTLMHTRRSFAPGQIIFLLVLIIILTAFASLVLSKIALRPLEKAWQQQLDFTANASHDLRTPLASLRLNLEIALENPGQTIAQQDKWFQNVSFEAERMSYILDHLLTLSRQDCETQEIIFNHFNVADAIEAVLNSLYPRAAKAELAIETHLMKELTYYGDLERFQQLITILADNAILYAKRPAKLTISTYKTAKNLQITVSDTGVGIAANDLPQIFERFYRSDDTRSSKIKGSGLGLAIAQGIMKEYHGTIQVSSVLNEGTVFTLNFPIEKK